MSRTLNFVEQLLDMGRRLKAHGQTDAAAQLLKRLASFKKMPRDSAVEMHLRLGNLYFDRGEYKRARRHLVALLTIQPDHAAAHHLLARACEDDDSCDIARALLHYRRGARLDRDNAVYWCDLGLLALDLGEKEEGLKALRRAGKLAADDPNVLELVLQGLCGEGETIEATRMLHAALFRNVRDQRFRELQTRHQFRLLHGVQQAKHRRCSHECREQHPTLPPAENQRD